MMDGSDASGVMHVNVCVHSCSFFPRDLNPSDQYSEIYINSHSLKDQLVLRSHCQAKNEISPPINQLMTGTSVKINIFTNTC